MWELKYCTKAHAPKLETELRARLAELRARPEAGFLQIGARPDLWQSVEVRAKEIRKSCNHLVVIGMGGSSLGGRALIQCLTNYGSPQTVEFMDNVDSERFMRWIKQPRDYNRTHWVLISKSGTSIETLVLAEFVDQFLRTSGFRKLSANATVVSDPVENPLTNWAKRESVTCLEVPQNVSGRFSVLTPVGLLPAAFYGLDLAKMQAGMEWAFRQDEIVIKLAAQSLTSFSRDEWLTYFWSYSDSLKDFGLWMQQLWSESLAKSVCFDGRPAPRASTPVPCIGASDQHSILQQVMEGARDKYVWFIRSRECESSGPILEKSLFETQPSLQGKTLGQLLGAEADATRLGLEEMGVASLTLECAKLDEATLSALFGLSMMNVALMGEYMQVPAFNQPGVELGKRLARQFLSSM